MTTPIIDTLPYVRQVIMATVQDRNPQYFEWRRCIRNLFPGIIQHMCFISGFVQFNGETVGVFQEGETAAG